MNTLTSPEAIRALQRFRDIHSLQPFTAARAKRLLSIAREFTYKTEPCVGGMAGIRFRGNVSGQPGQYLFEIEDHTGKNPAGRVVPALPARYTQEPSTHSQGGRQMPPRTRTKPTTQAPAPEPEVSEADELYDHMMKAYSVMNEDFISWFTSEVAPDWQDADGKRLTPDRILIAGYRMYSKFQSSDFNQERRAERKAAAAAGDGAEEEAPAPVPARRGRKPATAVAEPASNGPARPAKNRRRPATTAAY